MTNHYPLVKDWKLGLMLAALALHHENVEATHSDPMWDHIPSDVRGDFYHDLSAKERKLLGDIYRRAQQVGDRRAFELACDGLEQWMP